MKIRDASKSDLTAVEQLLTASDLPIEGVSPNIADFLVAEDRGELKAVIGLERSGRTALLRSAAVAEQERGHGLGTQLVEKLLERARSKGVEEVYLLTTTAEKYFPRFGFTRTTREIVPDAVKKSAEFNGACTDTAVVMIRRLTESTT